MTNDIPPEQQRLAYLFDCDVRFDKYDYGFATDLIRQADAGNRLSPKQEKYLRYFVYRYREQIQDKIIYEEQTTERLEEVLGEDPRTRLRSILDECRDAYDEISAQHDRYTINA